MIKKNKLYQQKLQSFIKILGLIVVVQILSISGKGQSKTLEIHRFHLENTVHLQGVAVDKNYFYAINNTTISKCRKNNGKEVANWKGAERIIKHLNSGVVIKDRLYCANSNFPDTPMTSSIEIFDVNTMKHISSHSFGIFAGSATWIDRNNGYWWVVFANYNDKHSFQGKDNRWTTLIKFNDDWQEMEAWVFPKEVLDAFSPNSNSGGNWSNSGNLYLTGHDKQELYVMQLPEEGSTLQLIRVIPTINPGQAFAIDHSVKNKEILYAVDRHDNAVIVEQIK